MMFRKCFKNVVEKCKRKKIMLIQRVLFIVFIKKRSKSSLTLLQGIKKDVKGFYIIFMRQLSCYLLKKNLTEHINGNLSVRLNLMFCCFN